MAPEPFQPFQEFITSHPARTGSLAETLASRFQLSPRQKNWASCQKSADVAGASIIAALAKQN